MKKCLILILSVLMFGCSGVSKEVSADRKPGPPKKEILEVKPVERRVHIQGYLENLKKSRELNIEETLSQEAFKIVKKVMDEDPLVQIIGTQKDELISLLEKVERLIAPSLTPKFLAIFWARGLFEEPAKIFILFKAHFFTPPSGVFGPIDYYLGFFF